jgi:hypothetical protein
MPPLEKLSSQRPTTNTPTRRRRSSTAESITVDSTPQTQAPDSTTPNTRKRGRLDYNTLNTYGFQGPPLPATESPRATSIAKKARQNNAEKSKQQSQQPIPKTSIPGRDLEEEEDEEKKQGVKRAYIEV